MDKITIIPKMLKGEVTVPPSKSLGHRGIISAALGKGKSELLNVQYSKDIEATLDIMKSLGAKIEIRKGELIIDGSEMFKFEGESLVLQCSEAGSTLRFLIPVALVKEGTYIFEGKGKLISRPLTPYYEIFEEKGIKYTTAAGNLPLTVRGKLESGVYRIPGNISSQFITGLLFALPILTGDSEIHITTDLESKGYVDLTLDVLKNFGIEISNEDYKTFKIKGEQCYKPQRFYIEGDYSQGAFFLVAGAIGSKIQCRGLKENSLQGDKTIIDILIKMGCKLERSNGYISALPSSTKGIEIDASQCPDLVPILAVLASLSKGTTKIVNAERLRIKECDRLMATTKELNKIGAKITELKDGLIIEGIESFTGGIVNSHNDHRIVMALAIAATRAKEPVIIENPLAIEKSYPNFFEDYLFLGGEILELNNRK